jgi:hypothetical protein
MATQAKHDGPSMLLAAAVPTVGTGRPDWGAAMQAELAELEDRRERWLFALGCVRSIAFRLPPPGSRRRVTVTAVVAGAASLAIVVAALARYPGLVAGTGTWISLGVFVGVILIYITGVARLGSRLTNNAPLRTVAVPCALIASSWLAVGLGASQGWSPAVSTALMAITPITSVAVGWVATTRSGSGRTGVGYVGIAAFFAGFTLFLLWAGEAVAAAGRPYDPGLLRDFRSSGASDLGTYAVSDSLGAGMMLLLLVPLVSLAGGLLGAAVASKQKKLRA